MSSLPTIESITTHFLFGADTIPDNFTDSKLIRPLVDRMRKEDRPGIEVDINAFMQGPGRFILPNDFDFIKYFFLGIPGNPSRDVTSGEVLVRTDALTPGKYSKQEIFEHFNITAFEDKTVRKSLGFYDDGRGDLLERAYVWNTSIFMLDDDARFVVTESGERFIENFAIRPYKNPSDSREEDFDFTGGFFSQLVNPYLEWQIDPSGIGRTVSIEFVGDVDKYTLTQDDFLAFAQLAKTWDIRLLTGAEVYLRLSEIVKRLIESDIIRLLDKNKPIIYGTDGDDVISEYTTTKGYDLHSAINSPWVGEFPGEPHLAYKDYVHNGISYVAGKGNDTVTGTLHGDHLRGNSGSDILKGAFGDDILYGGDGANGAGDALGNTLYGDAGSDRLYGGAGSDFLYAGSHEEGGADNGETANYLYGNGGEDHLYGDQGADILEGGAGADKLFGGPGQDLYFFMPGEIEGDVIKDRDGGKIIIDERALNMPLTQIGAMRWRNVDGFVFSINLPQGETEDGRQYTELRIFSPGGEQLLIEK